MKDCSVVCKIIVIGEWRVCWFMRFFLDNTGFQAVGRCIDGRATSDTDASDFFRFASYVVFAAEAHISGGQPTAVTERSDSISSQLAELGLPKELINTSRMAPHVRDNAVERASRRLVEELSFSSLDSSTVSPHLLAHAMPERRTLGASLDHQVRRAVDPHTTVGELIELEDKASKAQAAGWPLLMVTRNQRLREELGKLFARADWSDNHTLQMIVQMRFFLNQELAHSSPPLVGSSPLTYAPSCARSTIVASHSSYILDGVNGAIGEAIEGFQPLRLDLPPIAAALLCRAKGDPQGILEEALTLRCQAREFRDYCETLLFAARAEADQGRRSRHQIALFLKDTAARLTDMVRRPGVHSLMDSIEFDFLGLGFMPNPLKLFSWIEHKRKNQRLTALANMAYSITDYEVNANVLQRFRKLAFAKT